MSLTKTVTLDVREDLRQGREPFSKILGAAAALHADEELLLIAPFEPAPMIGVLGRQGFAHQAQPIAGGDWEVRFARRPGASPAEPLPSAPPACPEHRPRSRQEDVVEVDARGLEPPQPMVKILEALAALPAGTSLRARTDRRPMHLYARLEERGFRGESAEQPDGSFITHVRRQ